MVRFHIYVLKLDSTRFSDQKLICNVGIERSQVKLQDFGQNSWKGEVAINYSR